MGKKFEITRQQRGSDPVEGPVTSAMVEGFAVAYKSDGSGELVAAGPNDFVGFMARPVVSGGATLEQRVFQDGLPYPFKVGARAIARDCDEFEAEQGGGTMLESGGDSLSGSTPVGTFITVTNGLLQLYDATAQETAYFRVIKNDVTAKDGGTFRLRFRRVKGAGANAAA